MSIQITKEQALRLHQIHKNVDTFLVTKDEFGNKRVSSRYTPMSNYEVSNIEFIYGNGNSLEIRDDDNWRLNRL